MELIDRDDLLFGAMWFSSTIATHADSDTAIIQIKQDVPLEISRVGSSATHGYPVRNKLRTLRLSRA